MCMVWLTIILLFPIPFSDVKLVIWKIIFYTRLLVQFPLFDKVISG